MASTVNELVEKIKTHRTYSHPFFQNWARAKPDAHVVGALFHQIQNFCASTRPGGAFPDALKEHGLLKQSQLLNEIVESEDGHGPELATMAGYVVNQAAGKPVCRDLYNQQAVEAQLKEFSDQIFGGVEGYEKVAGLTPQTRRAIGVFDYRNRSDLSSTYRNLGAALALEIISNRHLIPGEKHCLIDSKLYQADLHTPEMHYLLEHWGEVGAEQQHEKNAIEAVASAFDNPKHAKSAVTGAEDFLDSLEAFWDSLDSALVQPTRQKMAV